MKQRILFEESAAVLIDVQQKLLPLIQDNNAILERSAILLSGFRQIGLPFFYCEQYPKGLGETVVELKPLLEDIPKFEKVTFSAMDDEAVVAHVKQLNKKNIILLGIETHVCVLQTTLDLLDAGYRPILVTDAAGSRKTSDHETALQRAQQAGCLLASSESILFELIRSAKHRHFKDISRLIK